MKLMMPRLCWLFVGGILAASRGCEGWLSTTSTTTRTSTTSSAPRIGNPQPQGRSSSRCVVLLPSHFLQRYLTSSAPAAAKVFYDPSTVSQTDLDKLAVAALKTTAKSTDDTKNDTSTDDAVTTTHKINIRGTNDVVESAPETVAPPLSYQKYLTMQEKRAVVQIRYSSDAGLKPYFLTVAKKLKTSHPDVIIERRILAKTPDSSSSEQEPTFEIWVDGKVVVGRTGKGSRPRKSSSRQGVQDLQKGRSIYVSMNELDLAICRARRKLRPASTVYGEGSTTSTTTTTILTKTGVDKNRM